jgi:hypothetical protein
MGLIVLKVLEAGHQSDSSKRWIYFSRRFRIFSGFYKILDCTKINLGCWFKIVVVTDSVIIACCKDFE